MNFFCLLWCFASFFEAIKTESILTTICYGDVKTLTCEDGNEVVIHGAFYKPLNENSSLCMHANNSVPPCRVPRLENFLGSNCHGKNECLLEYRDKTGVQKGDCQSTLYLNIEYKCVEQNENETENSGNILLQHTTSKFTPTSVTDTVRNTSRDTGYKGFGYLSLARLFLEFKVMKSYIADHHRYAILYGMISLAVGMLFFILFVACLMLCGRCCKKSGKFDVEDGERSIEVSAPVTPATIPPSNFETVLVTRQNGVPLSETTLSSDSTLTTRRSSNGKTDHHVISTIRRTHSIDEGTQTDHEDVESVDLKPQTLSFEEEKELGYLVNTMNFYNRRLDDDFYIPPKKNTQVKNSNNPQDRTRFFYSQPSDTKPLLTQPNSSSDNYSPNEDYSSDERAKFLSNKKYKSRNPSEVSYETSASNASDCSTDLYSPDSIFNGDTLRHNSRPRTPRTPKLGVRGDGFDFIQNGSRHKN